MKKRIAFIHKYRGAGFTFHDERESNFENERNQRHDSIESALTSKYNVWCNSNLCSRTQRELDKECEKNGNFDYIITHLPFSMAERSYEPSLTIVDEIHKKFPETKIILYTGATTRSLSDEFLGTCGVSKVVRKSEDLQTDIEAILEAVNDT